MNSNPLAALFGYFLVLSQFAVGGANAAVPEMHRVAVDVMSYADRLSGRRPCRRHVRAELHDGVRRCPLLGPFKACALAHRHSDRPRSGVARLIATSAFLLARAADHYVYAGLITAATAAITYWTRLNPLWTFFVAGLLGLTGWT
jgi:chromate transporter